MMKKALMLCLLLAGCDGIFGPVQVKVISIHENTNCETGLSSIYESTLYGWRKERCGKLGEVGDVFRIFLP